MKELHEGAAPSEVRETRQPQKVLPCPRVAGVRVTIAGFASAMRRPRGPPYRNWPALSDGRAGESDFGRFVVVAGRFPMILVVF